MKQTNSTQEHLPFLRSLLLVVILSILFSAAEAQSPCLSAQVTRDVTGSGLGGNVCPAIGVSKQFHSLSVGPNFQRKRMNLSGIQANYRCRLGQSLNKKFELYASANLTYHHSARMSDEYVEIEKSCNKENPGDFSKLRLQVVESYAGFGVLMNAKRNISLRAGVGMGMFYTMNKDYDRELYREKQSAALRMNFSVIYNFHPIHTIN